MEKIKSFITKATTQLKKFINVYSFFGLISFLVVLYLSTFLPSGLVWFSESCFMLFLVAIQTYMNSSES